MSQVSMIAVRALVAAVESMGGARAPLLAAAGLTDAHLDDVYARVPHAAYDRARQSALAITGDPALGLRIGGAASVCSYDFLGALAENSGTLREALQVACRFARVLVEGAQLDVLEDGDVALIRCPVLRGEAPEVRLSAEFTVSSLVYLVRRFVGSAAVPRRVFFGYAAPAHRDEYARAFAGRELFSQAFTGVEIDRAWLDCSHACGSRELHALLLARAQRFVTHADPETSTAERVKRWLSSQSPEVRPTMDAIARALGMSGRSLRRRLHEERAAYEDLSREARVLRAKTLLDDSARSIQEVAYALGFGTPAAFSRAFRRWTGMAPSTYRARA